MDIIKTSYPIDEVWRHTSYLFTSSTSKPSLHDDLAPLKHHCLPPSASHTKPHCSCYDKQT